MPPWVQQTTARFETLHVQSESALRVDRAEGKHQGHGENRREKEGVGSERKAKTLPLGFKGERAGRKPLVLLIIMYRLGSYNSLHCADDKSVW